MAAHKPLFNDLVHSGGRVEYFIGIHHAENMGFTFDPDLIKELSSLGIWVAFDMYAFDATNIEKNGGQSTSGSEEETGPIGAYLGDLDG